VDDAACGEESVTVFFPTTPAGEERALEICGGCPVRAECLQFAVERQQRHGIWGGTTERDRRRMIRGRRDGSEVA
jgi:WhiB family redox-sensing transcriptional regulator